MHRPSSIFSAFLLTSLVLFGGLLFPLCAEETLRHPPLINTPEIQLLDEEGKGKLYQVGEHRLCVLEGSPAEMGFQHGRLLAKNIEHIIHEGYFKKVFKDQGYTEAYLLEQSRRMEKHIPMRYIEEMKGIVAGIQAAGVDTIPYESILLGVTCSEILHFGPDAAPSCSNFACWGKWTTDGRLLHGRNLDWSIEGGAQEDAVTFIWRPEGRKPYMMIGWAGGVGSVSGMNAHGITIGEMTLPTPNCTFDGQPLLITMRRVLEESSNLDEAVALIEKGPQTTGWNFIIGDGKARDARAMEVDNKRCLTYTPNDPAENMETLHQSIEDAVRRTNHPVNKDGLLDLALHFGSKYGIHVENWDQLKALLSLLKAQDTHQRYCFLGDQITSAPKRIDVREAIDILANGPVYCVITLHAFVFDPSNLTAYIAIAGSNPPVTALDRSFTRIDLAPWFK